MTKLERNEKIIAEIVAGGTLREVGDKYNITKARVKNILDRAGYAKRYVFVGGYYGNTKTNQK